MKVLVLLLIVIAGVATIFSIGADHRRHSREKGDPTGSLLWHFQREFYEAREHAVKDQQQREDARIARNNACHQQMVALNATLQKHDDQVSTSLSVRLPRREKNRRMRQSHGRPISSFSPITSENSVPRKQAPAARAIAADAYPATEVSSASFQDTATDSTVKDAALSISGVLGTIRFTYASDGVQRVREVDARSVDGTYLKGFCHLRRMIRTFRFDRIVGDITCLDSGEIMPPDAWKRHARELAHTMQKAATPSGSGRRKMRNGALNISQRGGQSPESDGNVAVFFGGFHAGHRQSLEQMARGSGFMVRDTLDATVDLIVAGPMVGERQLRTANMFAVRVITENDFITMNTDNQSR